MSPVTNPEDSLSPGEISRLKAYMNKRFPEASIMLQTNFSNEHKHAAQCLVQGLKVGYALGRANTEPAPGGSF